MFIVLDRDGVINYDSDAYIKSPEEWIPIPGSLEAIAKLNRAGHQVAVATNQSGIARGFFDLTKLDAIHDKFIRELARLGGRVETICYCPHHPDAGCGCRKPKPGLLFEIAQYCHIDLKKTWFIGDSWVDVQAARAAGCRPGLVKTGKGLVTLANLPSIDDVAVFDDLKSFGISLMRDKLTNSPGHFSG